jgi:5-formyltetrahydrofolate cyclo-ligase
MTKADLRAQLRKKNAGPEAGRALVERLKTLKVFQEAATVGAYMPLPGEPDIRPLFALPGKQFFIPAFDETYGVYRMAALSEDLKSGKFRIPEPVEPVRAKQLDLLLVPGIAFDRHGNRLGRGGGFYDRLLAEYPAATAVGLCFDFQLVDSLPAEPHDRPVDWIVTESQVFGPF